MCDKKNEQDFNRDEWWNSLSEEEKKYWTEYESMQLFCESIDKETAIRLHLIDDDDECDDC